jgi:ferredoxin--NADP+ reductase
VIVDPADVDLDEASQAWLDSDEADKTSRENVRILREYAAREPVGKPKRIVFRFLTSPVELQGDERVERIVLERNRLEPREDGSLAARPTGERETLECGLVLRSIGYKGIAIPEVPFDERRGTIPNVAGRVLDGEHHVTGEYVTGWIRRGPSGVIGTNKKDGQEAATSLLEDVEAGFLNEPGGAGDIADLLAERGVDAISWEGWERIDAHEQELGAGVRPRVKLTRYELLHGAARRE